jgi:TRAP-type C4-dicarboxylate transport system permease large subunit
MGFIIFGYLIAGAFMDELAMITLTVPILYPVIKSLGFDGIWFGVVIVLVCEMGLICPPVGMNVFVIKGVAPEVPLQTIYRGIWPFLGADIVCAILLVLFPQIALFLPSFMTW